MQIQYLAVMVELAVFMIYTNLYNSNYDKKYILYFLYCCCSLHVRQRK